MSNSSGHGQYDLDPYHAAFAVMDDKHDGWRDQLERIDPCFIEQERAAFRRTCFRREWMSLGAEFSVMDHLMSSRPVPATASEWCFLLRAWLVQQGPFNRSGGQDFVFVNGALKFVTFAMEPKMLESIREFDKDIYEKFSTELWLAISRGCQFRSRFQYHPGAGGMRQSFMNVQISTFDRFLHMWPVQTDPCLKFIRSEIQPWWNEWQEWMQENRAPWTDDKKGLA
jgi:hypothetical protein